MIRLLAVLLVAAHVLAAHAQTPERKLLRAYLSQGEWVGVKLTDSGRALIADAIADAVAGTTVQMDINGLADLASSPEAQVRIADERIEAARAEFLRRGVAESDIAVQKIATADGSIPPPPPEAATKRIVIVAHY